MRRSKTQCDHGLRRLGHDMTNVSPFQFPLNHCGGFGNGFGYFGSHTVIADMPGGTIGLLHRSTVCLWGTRSAFLEQLTQNASMRSRTYEQMASLCEIKSDLSAVHHVLRGTGARLALMNAESPVRCRFAGRSGRERV